MIALSRLLRCAAVGSSKGIIAGGVSVQSTDSSTSGSTTRHQAAQAEHVKLLCNYVAGLLRVRTPNQPRGYFRLVCDLASELASPDTPNDVKHALREVVPESTTDGDGLLETLSSPTGSRYFVVRAKKGVWEAGLKSMHTSKSQPMRTVTLKRKGSPPKGVSIPEVEERSEAPDAPAAPVLPPASVTVGAHSTSKNAMEHYWEHQFDMETMLSYVPTEWVLFDYWLTALPAETLSSMPTTHRRLNLLRMLAVHCDVAVRVVWPQPIVFRLKADCPQLAAAPADTPWPANVLFGSRFTDEEALLSAAQLLSLPRLMALQVPHRSVEPYVVSQILGTDLSASIKSVFSKTWTALCNYPTLFACWSPEKGRYEVTGLGGAAVTAGADLPVVERAFYEDENDQLDAFCQAAASHAETFTQQEHLNDPTFSVARVLNPWMSLFESLSVPMKLSVKHRGGPGAIFLAHRDRLMVTPQGLLVPRPAGTFTAGGNECSAGKVESSLGGPIQLAENELAEVTKFKGGRWKSKKKQWQAARLAGSADPEVVSLARDKTLIANTIFDSLPSSGRSVNASEIPSLVGPKTVAALRQSKGTSALAKILVNNPHMFIVDEVFGPMPGGFTFAQYFVRRRLKGDPQQAIGKMSAPSESTVNDVVLCAISDREVACSGGDLYARLPRSFRGWVPQELLMSCVSKCPLFVVSTHSKTTAQSSIETLNCMSIWLTDEGKVRLAERLAQTDPAWVPWPLARTTLPPQALLEDDKVDD